MKTFEKDPSGVLDYVFDWVEWLGNDVIDDLAITVSPVADELIVDDATSVDGKVTVWLSGGILDKSYTVTCQITTLALRTDQRSAVFNMVDK